MKSVFAFFMAMTFVLSLGFAAYAADQAGSNAGKTGTTQSQTGNRMMAANELKASNIIGTKVDNRKGEELGKITDLVIDPKDNRVILAVLGHGGTVGMGEKYTAVPLSALTATADNSGKLSKFTLDMDKEQLAKAPTFDKKTLPDRTKMEEYYRYFGQRPYWSSEFKSSVESTTPAEKKR